MKFVFRTAALAFAFCVGSALADNLPSPITPPPVMTWPGLYGGVNIGYAWSESSALTGARFVSGAPIAIWTYPGPSAGGVLGGGQLGYVVQVGHVVGGVEADIQGVDLSGQSSGVGVSTVPNYVPFANSRQTIEWFGTVRARLGYAALPNLIIFGTGGFAYGGGSSSFTYHGDFVPPAPVPMYFYGRQSESDTRTGWTAGGGAEWAFWPNVSVNIEYAYVDLGRAPGFNIGLFANGVFNPAHSASSVGAENRFHTVRVGMNYHLNWGAISILPEY